jgi:protein-S-isoprenylcysteine O-methyltransferase Ste14
VGLTLRKLRLRAVWLLVLPFFFLARPTPRLLLLGGIVAAVGTAIRAWAAGTIRKERTLTTTGPYAHTRNPLYLGSFLIGVGATIAGGRWEFTALFLAFYVVVYGRTMRAEAELLAERFGERHADYARNVPLFVPRPIPWRADYVDAGEEGFTARQWRRNREYQALLGVVGAFAVLAAKLWWP